MNTPLSINLNTKGIDTSFPTLSVARHLVKVLGYELKESTNNPGLWMLRLSLETQEPAFSYKQKELPPGFKFNTNLTLPGDGSGEHDELRLRALCLFMDAVDGTDQESRAEFSNEWLETIKEKKVVVEMKKSKDDTYGETEVKAFHNLPQAA